MAGSYRHHISEEKKLVIPMSLRGMKTKDIELATGIKHHAIQRCISLWKSTGEVVMQRTEAASEKHGELWS